MFTTVRVPSVCSRTASINDFGTSISPSGPLASSETTISEMPGAGSLRSYL